MHIGLFFGTFNPVHVGHLMIANHIAQHSELDQVWLVVSPQNPLKNKNTLLNDYQRLHLVKLAIDDNPLLRASDVEFHLAKPSYTVLTLAYLKEKFPTHRFSLIMGEDNIRTLNKWYNYEYLLENHQIYVYPRVLNQAEQIVQQVNESATFVHDIMNHPSVIFCKDTPLMKLSSSFVRDQIKQGKSVKYVLTEPVLKYVEEMNFYKEH